MTRQDRISDTLSQNLSRRLVKADPFNICERIKEIDPAYFILRNINTNKYEVHNADNLGQTYCFTIPYMKLDTRTLQYCRETSTNRNAVENLNYYNEKLDRRKKRMQENLSRDIAMDSAERVAYGTGYRKTHVISKGVPQ